MIRRTFAKFWTVCAGPRVKVTRTSREMTPTEIAAFDEAFKDMGKVFDSLCRAFDKPSQ